jgi:hypothetical protein
MKIEKILPHLLAVILCLIVMTYFFKPAVLDKKVMIQGDVVQATAMQTEIQNYRKSEHATPSWTNQAYIGMPSYLVYSPQESNYIQNLTYSVIFVGGTYDISDTHVVYFWLAFLAYIGLLLFGFSPPVAIIAGLSYAMMTNNFSLLDAGHCNKVLAMAFALPVLGSAYRLMRGQWIFGGACFAAFMSLQVAASHVQMVYYTFFALAAIAISSFFYSLQKQQIQIWLRGVGLMAAGVVLAVLSNLTALWTTYEYSAESTRGRSELTQKETKSGMNKDDIYAWAHTKIETYTLILPNFMGGSSVQKWASEKGSATQEALKSIAAQGKAVAPDNLINDLAGRTPKYWGGQIFTGGPIYYGIVLMFLAILGLLTMRSPLRFGFGGLMLFYMMLSWGRDFSFFNDLMVDYFPFYNKFRDVKMTLAIGQSVVAVLAAFGLQFLINLLPKVGETRNEIAYQKNQQHIFIATAIMAGLCIFAVLYSFGGNLETNDPNYALIVQDLEARNPNIAVFFKQLEEAMQADRAGLIRSDAFKSLLFVLLAGGLSLAAARNMLHAYIAVAVLGLVATIDYGIVARDYINEKSFSPAKNQAGITVPSKADNDILLDKDPHFRVLDFSRGNPASSALTSYFHQSVGGHHAAKPMLYDEFTKAHGFPVEMIEKKAHLLEMINTKYVIQSPEVAIPMAGALGNAWFVAEIKTVANADEELAAIGNFEPRTTAIVQQRFADYTNGLNTAAGANDRIILTKYHPDTLRYKSTAETERFAVFSEMYYPPAKGWNTYIDGKLVETSFVKVNYLLRGMRVPAGEHVVEMRFEPKSVSTGETMALLSSLLILAGLGFAAFNSFKAAKNENIAV